MKLRVLRAERQLSLREASERTGVDKVVLSRLERGLSSPRDLTLSKIAKGYGISVEKLLELEEVASAPLGETREGRVSAQLGGENYRFQKMPEAEQYLSRGAVALITDRFPLHKYKPLVQWLIGPAEREAYRERLDAELPEGYEETEYRPPDNRPAHLFDPLEDISSEAARIRVLAS